MLESPIFSLEDVISKEVQLFGNLPVLISVPHDGRKTRIGHQYICPLPGGIPGDRNVRYIARDICKHVADRTGFQPSLLIDDIKRNRRWATEPYYGKRVKHRIAQIAEEFENVSPKPPLLLDLHGFVNQPPFGHYDLILGTAHRTAVKTDVDLVFGAFMMDRGYKIYVPGDVAIEDELFTAEPEHTLTKQVSTEFPYVDCLQVEIFRDFRTLEGRERGIQLASDVGDFIGEYASHY